MIQKKVRIELGTSGAESTHLKFGKKKTHTHMKKKSVLALFELVTSGAETKHLRCFLLTTRYMYDIVLRSMYQYQTRTYLNISTIFIR